MTKRGKVLRDPHAGPGLLMVEGQQHQFTLEGVWKSEAPPRPGLPVDVEFDQGGQVLGITVVAESQIAKEQAEAAMAAAREKGSQWLGKIVAIVGVPKLVAGGLLIIGWFFLSTVTVQLPFLGKLEYTFWQILGFLNASNVLESLERNSHPSTGIYGFFCIVALAGPFVQYVWKDKRALLGGLAPLVFMVIVGIAVRSSIQSAFGTGNDATGLGQQMQEEAMKAISLGMGVYLSILVSLYFAGIGTMKFLAAKGSATEAYKKPERAAA